MSANGVVGVTPPISPGGLYESGARLLEPYTMATSQVSAIGRGTRNETRFR